MPCDCKNCLGFLPTHEVEVAPETPIVIPYDHQLCCDCNGCCKAYCKKNRDPFWPKFTRPRWLPCCELYDFHGCGECGDDNCADYDPCKNKPKPPVHPAPPHHCPCCGR